MSIRTPLFIILSLGLSACAALNRHQSSGYYRGYENQQSSAVDFYREKRHYMEAQVKRDLGLPDTRPLTEEEQLLLNMRISLQQAEESLQTRREKKQYYKHKAFMKDDQQRLYFLSLPSIEARKKWIENSGLSDTDEGYSDELADAIEDNDLILGMTPKAVLESWGDPDVVEVSGDPVYGNERWKYAKYVSSTDGYRKEHRFVYFEAGRVVGWENF